MRQEYTYLLHFEDRHGHAQHVLWWTDDLEQALLANACGFGPGLVGAFVRRGVRYEVVAVWEGGAERRRELRRKHNNRRLCCRCLYGRAQQLKLFEKGELQ
jgi:hypothetical protein